MSKIIGNYKEVQMDKESYRIHLTTEIKKILALDDNIKDKDKKKLFELIKDDFSQEIFINLLSQLRANGSYEKSQSFCELIGSGLNEILYYLQKTDNYAKARHCIILSQTFFYKDINNQKIHIFNYIKDNKWINHPKFWRGFIGIMLKTELDRAANFLKPKFGEVLLSQLLPYVNNMKQFGLDMRIIIKITDEFLEKYKYLNEQSYKILFNILSNDNELIEKYRKEYKENPDLENQLYNNENQNNPQNKNSIENKNEIKDKNLTIENELKKEEIQKNENKKEQKINIHGFYITEINPDIKFIVGTSYFFSVIKDIFFIHYKDICFEKFLENTKFRYIECDKDVKFKVSSFPDISFENKEFDEVFTLTYEDLFIYDEESKTIGYLL
jgi:hypothetical protein